MCKVIMRAKFKCVGAFLGTMLCLFGCDATSQGDGIARTTSVEKEQTGVYFEKANKALINGEVEQALMLCQEGVAQGEMPCHRLLGIAYKQKGDKQKACAEFKLAVKLDDPHMLTIKRYQKHLRCNKLNASGATYVIE